MDKYEKQANDFLSLTNSTLKIEFLKNDYYFNETKQKRDIYQCVLSRGSRFYAFTFGQSLNNSSAYIVNAGPITKSFDNKKDAEAYAYKVNGNGHVYQNKDFKKPTAYDVLSCLQKYDVGSFEDFCNEFGYNDLPLSEYTNTKITYDKAVDEYNKLLSLYNDKQMDILRDIN